MILITIILLKRRGMPLVTLLWLMVLATPVPGQERRDRDLLEVLPADPASREFAISFLDLGRLSMEPTSVGVGQLEVAAAAYGGCRDCVLIVEANACNKGLDEADYPATRSRAEAVVRYLSETTPIAVGQVFLLIRIEGAEVRSLAESDHLAKHGTVQVRRWGDEQMADLAPFLIPPPPSAAVVFRSRPSRDRGFQVIDSGEVLASGDEFQIEISAGKPVYAYVFHRGSAGLWECLYPDPKEGAPVAAPQARILLPDSRAGYMLDNTPGTEETFVFLGDRPNPRLDAWVKDGVPWHTEPSQPGEGKPQSTVRVASPAEHINWYRRLRFEHRSRAE